MSLKQNIIDKEIQTIKKLGNIAVVNIVDSYKDFLVENGLVYEGKIVDFDDDNIDGLSIRFNNEFQDFIFKNSTILRESTKIVLLLEESDGNNKKRSKRRVARPKRKDGGNADGEGTT